MKKRLSVSKARREKLASTGKIVVGALLLLLMIPTLGMVWIKDSRQDPSYCAGCHADPYYAGWLDGGSSSLAAVHAEYSISCQTCHDRTLSTSIDEMVQAYTVGYAVPMKERKLPMEMCLQCHGGSYASLIPLTDATITGAERNPHDSHWGEMECGVCHNMHRDSIDYCAGCHNPVTNAPGWVTPPEVQSN